MAKANFVGLMTEGVRAHPARGRGTKPRRHTHPQKMEPAAPPRRCAKGQHALASEGEGTYKNFKNTCLDTPESKVVVDLGENNMI